MLFENAGAYRRSCRAAHARDGPLDERAVQDAGSAERATQQSAGRALRVNCAAERSQHEDAGHRQSALEEVESLPGSIERNSARLDSSASAASRSARERPQT